MSIQGLKTGYKYICTKYYKIYSFKSGSNRSLVGMGSGLKHFVRYMQYDQDIIPLSVECKNGNKKKE